MHIFYVNKVIPLECIDQSSLHYKITVIRLTRQH